MHSGFNFIQKYIHWLLFVFFEVVAIVLIVSFNQKQRDIFLYSSSLFSGSLLKKTSEIGDYLKLRDSNDDLLQENARLLRELISTPQASIEVRPDTSLYPYEVFPARIINNNIHGARNYFTIDIGSKDGVQPSMGVITINGIAGIVKQVSSNYATVLSLINTETIVSATIEGQDFFGTISWDGYNFQSLTLTGIPKYAQVNRGDKIVTNGFSTIFPENIPIGIVGAFDVSKNGVFYEISVNPSIDFASLGYVYVLKDNFADERKAVELDE